MSWGEIEAWFAEAVDMLKEDEAASAAE
jgi:hypothetical protein